MIGNVLEFSTNCHTDTNLDLGCYKPAGTLPSTSGEQVHWDRGQHAEYRRNFVVARRQELEAPEQEVGNAAKEPVRTWTQYWGEGGDLPEWLKPHE